MIGVADNAFVALRRREAAMKALLRLAVGADVFVATRAQRCDGLVRVGVMTGLAVVFDIGVTLDNSTGHQQLLESSRIHQTAAER